MKFNTYSKVRRDGNAWKESLQTFIKTIFSPKTMKRSVRLALSTIVALTTIFDVCKKCKVEWTFPAFVTFFRNRLDSIFLNSLRWNHICSTWKRDSSTFSVRVSYKSFCIISRFHYKSGINRDCFSHKLPKTSRETKQETWIKLFLAIGTRLFLQQKNLSKKLG